MIIQGANALDRNKSMVDALNVFPVPDGDTGTNMSLTMNSAMKEIKQIDSDRIEKITEALANGSLMGARGNSGVILSQLFRGFAKSCKGKERLNTADVANALKSAADTAYKAVMKPIEGTILTVAREVGEKALEICKKEEDIQSFIRSLIAYGEKVLDKTPEMLKVLKEAGVVDAGGKGLIVIFNGFYEGMTGKDIEIEPFDHSKSSEVHLEKESEDIAFGYCTEFIIKNHNIDIQAFKQKITEFGDCMLVVGDENLVKVHIHTNNPGVILEYGLELGQLVNIKIDNMRQQHENKVFTDSDEKHDLEMKKYGMIAVTMGEGLTNIFKDLNVDEIITGGQTMNPSTEDIKKAVDRIQAEHIFIFPNNSNVILAANQAKELSNKAITVIPTKTIPQGISGILAFNDELDIDTNIELMTSAVKKVKTGQITYSVRDTQLNDMMIRKDDILGIQDGKITVVGNDVDEEAYHLLQEMITEEDEMITIFYGSESDEGRARHLAERIHEVYEDIDVEVYYGGQPLYYYIFSVE